MNRVGAYGIALALALPPSFLDAQETPTLAPGARVRVSVPKSPCSDAAPRCYRKVVGTLTSVDSLNIVVRSAEDSAELSLPRVPGTQLDISRGPGPCFQRRGTCVSLGFLGGVAVGALVGIAAGGAQTNGCVDGCPDGLVFLLSIPSGAVLGVIVGASLPAEYWEASDVPARLSVGPVGRNRLGLGLSVRF